MRIASALRCISPTCDFLGGCFARRNILAFIADRLDRLRRLQGLCVTRDSPAHANLDAELRPGMRAREHINLTGDYTLAHQQTLHPPGPLDDRICQ
jgi:hypothetical protein